MGAVVVAFAALSLGSTVAKGSGSPGPVVASWRFLVAAVVWHAIVAVGARRSGGPRAVGRLAWRVGTVPGIALGLNLACFFAAATRTPIAHAELLAALAPLLVVPLGARLHRERVERSVVVAGVVAIVGVGVVLGAAATGAAARTSLGGDLLVGVSVVMWAVYLVRSRRARSLVPTVQLMAVVSTVAWLTTIPVAIAGSGARSLVGLTGRGWFLVVLLGLGAGVLAHGTITWANGRVPLGAISLLQLAQPALGVTWAALFLGQRVTGVQVLGIALVLGAVGTIARRTARTTPTGRGAR